MKKNSYNCDTHLSSSDEYENLIFNMANWTVPIYSREQVNTAGNVLIGKITGGPLGEELAYNIINNWRASHNFPLNTIQARLRIKAKEVDKGCIVVQRIKRLSSIKHKLERFNNMKLSQIQDIGGCRAIMSNIERAKELVDVYKHKSSGLKHKFIVDDYISSPKSSGYRGVHIIFKYKSDKNIVYDDLKIEIQIRTKLQHAWATAVETASLFLNQPFKSSLGSPQWLRFFKLMSSIFAIEEGCCCVPDTSDSLESLKDELLKIEKQLRIESHLRAFRISLEVVQEQKELKDAHYYLLELDPIKRNINIKAYKQNQFELASKDYLELEKKIGKKQTNAVLVSADSMESLRTAFPNYYLDTDVFLQTLNVLKTK